MTKKACEQARCNLPSESNEAAQHRPQSTDEQILDELREIRRLLQQGNGP